MKKLSPDLEKVNCNQLFNHTSHFRGQLSACNRAAQLLWSHLSASQKQECCDKRYFTVARTEIYDGVRCHLRIHLNGSPWLLGWATKPMPLCIYDPAFDYENELPIGDRLLLMKLAAEAGLKRFIYIGTHCNAVY